MIQNPVLRPKSLRSFENTVELARRFRHALRAAANPRNKNTVSGAQYREYFKFTIVRNPWARAYSWYRNVMSDAIHLQDHGLSGEIDFPEFLERFGGKGALRPQLFWLVDFEGNMVMDFVGRFERLSDDFRTICDKLGLDHSELPHENKGSTSNYRDHYDGRSISLIQDISQREIEMFGYTFEG